MHEFSLVEALISSLEKMGKEEGWGRVTEIRLRVGALRQVFPDILEFAFETASTGTFLQGARLLVEEVPLSYRCLKCGTVWGEEGGPCPACGSGVRETLAGMEMDIQSVEVEEKPWEP